MGKQEWNFKSMIDEIPKHGDFDNNRIDIMIIMSMNIDKGFEKLFNWNNNSTILENGTYYQILIKKANNDQLTEYLLLKIDEINELKGCFYNKSYYEFKKNDNKFRNANYIDYNNKYYSSSLNDIKIYNKIQEFINKINEQKSFKIHKNMKVIILNENGLVEFLGKDNFYLIKDYEKISSEEIQEKLISSLNFKFENNKNKFLEGIFII